MRTPSQSPITLYEPFVEATPLVVDSPHSGRIYPADFHYTCPLTYLRQTEDFLVDELVTSARDAGATVLLAEFPRCYIDVNRAEDDLDPALLNTPWPYPLDPSERTRLGLGLIRRLCRSGMSVYDRQLTVKEVEYRIHAYYRPYHTALQATIKNHMQRFGTCTLINCHSMPSRSERADPKQPDFVLGDRDGTSCDPSLTRRVHNLLHDLGYSVALNDPFKGVEIARRYGQPTLGQHVLQLEINRQLYMNEERLEKISGFSKLNADLKTFFMQLATSLESTAGRHIAAE